VFDHRYLDLLNACMSGGGQEVVLEVKYFILAQSKAQNYLTKKTDTKKPPFRCYAGLEGAKEGSRRK